MAEDQFDLRRAQYFGLSSQIAQLDNAKVRALLESSEASNGWGRHQTVDVGQKVFVKRIPVTDLEFEHAFSTRNLYDLPTYYNYGVGSAGFGVFRELVMHIKTTNWVLAGAIANFPLMYHYRVMPFSGPRTDVPPERVQGYVDYWNGNESVARYWSDRARANHELVLFLEYIPHALHPWLLEQPAQIQRTLDELRTTITFLREHGIIHFDAHFNNVVTDGERPYLTDFGLALDRSFALSQEEIAFFEQHTHYDYGEVLWATGSLTTAVYETLAKDEKRRILGLLGVADGKRPGNLIGKLVENIETLATDRALGLHPNFVATLIRYRGIICLMDDFYADMHANKRKDTILPLADLRRFLREASFDA